MASFTYQATDQSGNLVRGVFDAKDESDLRAKLQKQRNLLLVSASQAKISQQRGMYKYKTKPLAIFTRQLAAMLSAGVSLPKAFNILMTQEEDKKCKELLRQCYEDLLKGNQLTQVLQNKRNSFPNLFIAMVAAGESSGNLDMIIERVSEHYMSESKTQNTIRKAMIYPIILGVLMIGVVMAMFIFILPMFVAMFDDPSQIPPLSRVLMAISDFMKTFWYLVIGGLVALAVAIPRILKLPGVSLWWGKTIITAPKIGTLVGTIYTARFARTMSNLFASGLQMIDCIEKSVDVIGNDYVTEKFKGVVSDVKKGETLSASVDKTKIFSGIFVATILIGEESGQLDSILEKSAEFYEEEANTAVESLVSMLEPVMIIVMGGMVGLVLAGIFPLLYGSMGGIANE